jgi:hypothetical protein
LREVEDAPETLAIESTFSCGAPNTRPGVKHGIP